MQWRWINKKIPNCNHRNSKRNNLVISKKISLSPIRLAFVKISRVPKKACLNHRWATPPNWGGDGGDTQYAANLPRVTQKFWPGDMKFCLENRQI